MKTIYILIATIVLTALAVYSILSFRPELMQHLRMMDSSLVKTSTVSENMDTSKLPEAKLSEIVDLADGATYEMTAGFVKKTIRGKELQLLAYNGMIPGPTIRAKQGSTVHIIFKNMTDTENTIHPHGVRLDNAFDGIPGVTQAPVKPGESFTYTIKFPDAGAYWYHPHMSEPYSQASGLYGNYIVTPDTVHTWKDTVDREVPFFVSDMLLDENGNLAPFGERDSRYTLMGRYGNTLLINGQMSGEGDNPFIAKKGETIRFYVTNSANTRPFRLTIPGVRMKLIWSDGGAYEQESWTDTIIIAPSERYIFEARFDTAGDFSLVNDIPSGKMIIGAIKVKDDPSFVSVSKKEEFETLHTYESTAKSIDPFRNAFDKAPDKKLTLSVELKGMMGGMGGHMGGGMMENTTKQGTSSIEWDSGDGMMQMMNQSSNPKNTLWKIIDTDTKKENMDIRWNFKKGDMVKIRIWNDPASPHAMQHPIHFHGQRFLVLEENGVRQKNLVWKDTVMIPSGDTVDILLDASNIGKWMAHCHISEHLEGNMMLNFDVQ